MNKKKYIIPICECITLGTTIMMSTSINVYGDVTGSDAYMSNTKRGGDFGSWN